MKDYIIVGAGLAGISFAETARRQGKSFIVINDSSQNSSLVAAGIYNPVILKRFSLPADAAAHLEYIHSFYRETEELLDVRFDVRIPVYRKFSSAEEQNNWFEAADKPALAPFLSPVVVHAKYPCLESPFGFGEVLHTGYIDTLTYINAYRSYLAQQEMFMEETFDHAALDVGEDFVSYKAMAARHIIFAEGFGIHSNPYFRHLPLEGTKGELLLIKAPGLELDAIVNAGIFILPLGNGLYKVGATYEWYDKTPDPTEAGKKELVEKLGEAITCPYEIVSHLAGIRPTVKDRKPLVGTHLQYRRIHLLNGLGTRGVLLGPPMAKALYDSVESGIPLHRSVNLERFKQ